MAKGDNNIHPECRVRFDDYDGKFNDIFKALNDNPNGVIPRLSRLEGLLKGISIVGLVLLVLLAVLEVLILIWKG